MKNLRNFYEKGDEETWEKVQMKEIKQRENERFHKRKFKFLGKTLLRENK